MKRTVTMITAAIFAGAIALPAFAQVGAGIAGNANVGQSSMRSGASGDVSNGDAERTDPNAPANTTAAAPRHHRMNAPAAPEGNYSNNEAAGTNAGARANGGIGTNAGVGANVGGAGANVGAGANAGDKNSPTGGY